MKYIKKILDKTRGLIPTDLQDCIAHSRAVAENSGDDTHLEILAEVDIIMERLEARAEWQRKKDCWREDRIIADFGSETHAELTKKIEEAHQKIRLIEAGLELLAAG